MSGRIFVLHIMKTAGTSLRLMLSKTLGPDRVFPNHSDLRNYPRRWYPPNGEMAAKVASPPRSGIDCFIGHYTYAFVANLPVRIEAVTFLRDPIARTVSMLKHHRRFLDVPDTPLETILDDTEFVDLMIKNYMTKVFSIENPLQGVNTRYTISESELARAVENLSKMSFVGFVDNFYVDFAKLTIWLSGNCPGRC
jgi:hypothetical protein